MALNLLQAARCNPKVSAYSYLEGQHNYNKVPLSLPGTKVFVHSKPNKRSSWAYHGQVGWYVGPVVQHYRYFRIFMPHTGREIITDTVKFLPEKIPFPTESFKNKLRQTVNKIIHLLNSKQPHPILPPLAKNTLTQAFVQVKNMLRNQVLPQKNVIIPTKDFIPRKSTPEPRVQGEIHKDSVAPPNMNVGIKVPTLPPMPTWPIAKCTTLQTPMSVSKKYINHIFDALGKKRGIDSLITDPTVNKVWLPALENELGRLYQGFKN